MVREKLAELCHEQWSSWTRYLFEKTELSDDGVLIPEWGVIRWTRQLSTDYQDLSDEEKDNERREADKFLPFVKAAFVAGLQIGHGNEFSIDNIDEEWDRYLGINQEDDQS